MALTPLNVESSTRENGDELFLTWVGVHGKVYPLSFVDLLNFIRSRQGFQQKRLEYKK